MDASRLPSLGPRGEGWVVIQFLLFPLVVAAGVLGGNAWVGALGLVSALAGLVLMVAGGLLTVRGILNLGAGLTPFPRPPDGALLIQSGAYRRARHPIYGGLILIAFGWSLLLASPSALLLGAVVLVFFDLKSRREEVWLEQRFPDYVAYRAHTKRLIPWAY